MTEWQMRRRHEITSGCPSDDTARSRATTLDARTSRSPSRDGVHSPLPPARFAQGVSEGAALRLCQPQCQAVDRVGAMDRNLVLRSALCPACRAIANCARAEHSLSCVRQSDDRSRFYPAPTPPCPRATASERRLMKQAVTSPSKRFQTSPGRRPLPLRACRNPLPPRAISLPVSLPNPTPNPRPLTVPPLRCSPDGPIRRTNR